MTDLLCDKCGKFMADGIIGPNGNFHYQCAGADGSGIDWTERPSPNTYAAPVFEPMTSYAEQAEQARERLERCKKARLDNSKEAQDVAFLSMETQIRKQIFDALDTLARVEAAVSEQYPTPYSLYGLGYEYCRDAVLKALEGE